MIRVERLRVRYRGAERDAVEGISFEVSTGEVLGFLGPNGAGKSTLLAVAAGLLEPSAGRVWFDGQDVTGRPPSDLDSLGVCLIPEGRGIFPALTVRDNLRIAAGNGSFEAATDLFPILGQRLSQTAGTLSGGEQQMLSMTRALLRTPRLLLIDELSLGLAPRIVDELYDAVRAIHAGGCAVVVVEQYVDRALELCELVAILEGGHVRFAGEPGEFEALEGDGLDAYLGVDPHEAAGGRR